MKGLNRQRGFTLIELLVVIAILGVLSSITVPNVSRFIGAGRAEAAKTELQNIQVAVDQMMVFKGKTSVTVTVATSNMAAFPNGDPLYPDFLRSQHTKGAYSCLISGLVTQESTGY